MSRVVQLPQRRERDALLASLDSAALVGYQKYLRWRLDCTYLVRGLDSPIFQTEDMADYHERELKNEINFCLNTIKNISLELKNRGIN